jgi:hypothetical protein
MTGMRPIAPREPKWGETKVTVHHSAAVAASVKHVTLCCREQETTRVQESKTGTRATDGL